MSDENHTEFEIEQTDEEPADIWVDEVFVNSYNDQRAYLAGDTYDSKEIIKFDWETTHHDFDGSRKQWVVDVDALDELAQRLEDEGFKTDFDAGNDVPSFDSNLYNAHSYVEAGDRITVEYIQKNGEGTNTKSGEVTTADYLHEEQDRPIIRFRRDDDQWMSVKFDDSGSESLFTSGSHAPYVGAVVRLTVHTDEDREIETPESDEDEDDQSVEESGEAEEDTAPDADSLPWGSS